MVPGPSAAQPRYAAGLDPCAVLVFGGTEWHVGACVVGMRRRLRRVGVPDWEMHGVWS